VRRGREEKENQKRTRKRMRREEVNTSESAIQRNAHKHNKTKGEKQVGRKKRAFVFLFGGRASTKFQINRRRKKGGIARQVDIDPD